MARTIGQQFTQAWGQQVLVEPRPGASGNIAAELVAKAPPDGYTLYVCYGTHTVNPSIYPRVGLRADQGFRADIADRDAIQRAGRAPVGSR